MVRYGKLCAAPYLLIIDIRQTGYSPRVLIFSLQDTSSDIPLVILNEHTYGVRCVAFSPDQKYLASLGSPNDGFLYVWAINQRTGAAKLHSSNKCTSFVKQMIWLGSSIVTYNYWIFISQSIADYLQNRNSTYQDMESGGKPECVAIKTALCFRWHASTGPFATNTSDSARTKCSTWSFSGSYIYNTSSNLRSQGNCLL